MTIEFYNTDDFPFVKEFESNWQAIHQEYLTVQSMMVDWPEHHLHNKNWDVFGLYDFPNGNAIEDSCKMCPITSSIIKKHITKNGAGGFSRLRANSSINPHRGYYGDFLRLHLGLDVPAGDCAIKVGDTTRQWANGRVMIFDDRLTHEAWNKTNYDRAVLIVDFVP